MKIEVHSPTIRRKEMDAVLTAMVEDRIGPGECSRLLIQTAKEYLRFDFAVALRSPATALRIAVKAVGLEDGDGVAISALSPLYYASVLSELRLTPVFCDVSFSFPCMSVESIEKAIAAAPEGKKPRCIVLHHTLGFVPDTAAIAGLGLPVIDDISQSYCCENAAAAGVFSILGLEERDALTAGGGALLFATNKRDSSVLRNHSNLPLEYRLPDINAALATVQFKEAVKNLERRKEIANAYAQASLRNRHKKFVPVEGREYNHYAFTQIIETGVKDVTAYARKKEILIENVLEQTLAGAGISDSVLCPVSHSLALRTLSFPLYPRLRSREIERVTKLLTTLP